jgi:hypothetical protein
MKQARISRPVSVRIGMFWRFGLTLERRPVDAVTCSNVVCRRPSGPTQLGSASR